MSAPIRKGTRKKQGTARGPAPGGESLTREDVAPRRGSNWIVWIIPGFLALGGLAWLFLGLVEPTTETEPEGGVVVIDDDAATGGDLGE
jgi:hypothetical protein